MKRFKIASAFLAGAMLFSATSCEKFFEDDVVSPNDPESSTASLLMANIEVATFATFGGQLARQSEVMVQRLAGTSAGSQTVEIANYVITDQTNQNEWDVIYTGVMANSRIMLRDYGASSPWYAGITKVLMAMNIGLATDLWGDVPFAEAGFGDNLEPAFESQQSIYSGIQSLLDEAIADLSSPEASNTFLPTTDDFIYNGDVMMWIQTARVLKARYANHLSKRDPAGSAAAALAAISAGGMTSSGDNCNMVFFNSGNSLNQWFAYEGQRGGYIRVSATLLDAMVAKSDPRVSVLFGQDAYGGYSGTPYDQVDSTNSSYIGSLYASAASPVPLVTYVEQLFIEAEASLRSGNAAAAATAHNNAVKESILFLTGSSDAAYEAANANETAGSISLEKIMTEKNVAMFLQAEGYTDWRRTGFPTLAANPNAALSGIPRRLPTPQQERLYNSNAIVVSDILSPVWWDQ
jgi:hypothetical protein